MDNTVKTNIKVLVTTLAALLVITRSAAAVAPNVEPGKVNYAALAGEPISTVQFTRLMAWHDVDTSPSDLGPTQLIVQTGVTRALLLTLYSPCRDLDFSIEIGLTSFGHQLSAGFDKVLVPGHQSCRIKTIQALDVKAMRAAEKAARLARS
jgi:hypothetical protein